MAITEQPIHGNYHGYYTKRPAIIDPRLALLPPTIFHEKVVLDIGCNEGWVTCEIAQRWKAKKVIGVDIDESLINAAWKRRRHVWSLQKSDKGVAGPQALDPSEHPKGQKRKREVIEEENIAVENCFYFPSSFAYSFGALPIPVTGPSTSNTAFPHNVTFKATDWLKQGTVEDEAGYDVILAFSVTKWIHLNGGDEAIVEFFRKVFRHLRPGGKFVLEPQNWAGYSKAKRMGEKLKENAKSLRLRPEGFEDVLKDIGFSKSQHLGTVGEGGQCAFNSSSRSKLLMYPPAIPHPGFKRTVELYIKPASDVQAM
ncbi:hypothetical protein FRC03_012962 [Tulasnella sp. 419]|nr:hypothetical protein FRC03_012962 [Tulasnella sp. 419]